MQDQKSWRLSWIAYFKSLLFLPIGSAIITVIIMIALSIIMGLLSSFVLEEATIQIIDAYMENLIPNDKLIPLYFALIIWALTTLFFGILMVLSMRSIRLYYDEEGIWYYSGIFPWNKGCNGIKWRDLDSGFYTTGFVSWALKSYSVTVTHRFTKDFEIVVKHVRKGDEFVKTINERHRQYVETNTISEA